MRELRAKLESTESFYSDLFVLKKMVCTIALDCISVLIFFRCASSGYRRS